MREKYVVLLLVLTMIVCCDKTTEFHVEETTISEIHEALKQGKITCQQLVNDYLNRIKTYDQSSKLNAIIIINPKAMKRAQELDKEFRETGKLRPLHGIPLIVKDNYDTHDLPTTGGSIALKGSLPPDDAYQVRVLRQAGAVVLAKSNMAEWAFSPYVTESSISGITRNPYDLSRVPAGSSGGTAAAIAANFGGVGLGTDTGNSIRGPSSHNCLVGIRSTMGLTSRDGIIPLYLRNDIGGPMARTVEDAVRIFQVIAGPDPADPITQLCRGKVPNFYTKFLDKKGLKGARIGIFRFYFETPSTDPQIKTLFETAIKDMKKLGAIIIDPFVIPMFAELKKNIWCDLFQYDVNNYLSSLGEKAPYKTIKEIFEAGLYSPYIKDRLQSALKGTIAPEQRNPPCLDVYHDKRNIALRQAVIKAMEKDKLDAFIFSTWSNLPRKVGDMKSPAGDNSQILSPHTGMPAITVPMGFSKEGLPAGLQIVGKLFDEGAIIKFAYAYEQATKHRRPPPAFPRLK